MSESSSERRLAENEVLFRQYNERVQKGFDDLQKIANEDGQTPHLHNDDIPLYFYCECSDENCHERIQLKSSRYNEIHQNRRRFIIKCGHETQTIEKIIEKEPNFCIIEKYEEPPKSAKKMNKSDIDNQKS